MKIQPTQPTEKEYTMNVRKIENTSASDAIDEVRRETQDYRLRVDYSGEPIDKIYVFRGPHAEEVHAGPNPWNRPDDPGYPRWFIIDDEVHLKEQLLLLIFKRGITTKAAADLWDRLQCLGFYLFRNTGHEEWRQCKNDQSNGDLPW
jgi:hypothetical protein